MNRKEMISDILILIISTGVGFEIAMFWEGNASKIIFIVIEVLTLLYIVSSHKDCKYYCTQCGTKYKISLISDLVSMTMENGDKVIKCKKCKKKTIFRRI